MKIVTPLADISHYVPLMQAGAGEFYSGIVPIEWLKKYNMVMPINRREWFLSKCNICTYTEMMILRKLIEEYHVPVKITLNSHYYIPEQYPLVLEIIKRLMDIGFDTFIIADIALIMFLRQKNIMCKIHLSGEAEVVNHLSMNYLEDYQISRYVFPRKVTINNMEEIIKKYGKKEQEFEAFVLNSYCQYSAGFCNSIHCDYLPTTCWLPSKIALKKDSDKHQKLTRSLKIIERMGKENAVNDNVINEYRFAKSGCGVCSINTLGKIGVQYLKIVGRGHDLDWLVRDVMTVRNIIDDLSVSHMSKEYVVEKYLGNICPDRCYYREIK